MSWQRITINKKFTSEKILNPGIMNELKNIREQEQKLD